LRASSEPEADSAGAAPLATGRRPVLRPPSSTTAHLYVHVSLADLLTCQRPQPVSPTATVERLGALTVGLVRDWLARCDKVSVRPVLHLTDPDSTANRPGVDQHDPPGWMRESVILRDGTACSPAAPSTPVPATRTTLTPTFPSTRVGHPARPRSRTWPACAGDTTDSRPTPPGDIGDCPTATTCGRAPPATPT
jgi:hypothetical protein